MGYGLEQYISSPGLPSNTQEFYNANEQDENEQLTNAINAQADKLAKVGTHLAAKGAARLFIKKKTGLFGKYRTKLARKRFTKSAINKYGGYAQSATRLGAQQLVNKYLND